MGSNILDESNKEEDGSNRGGEDHERCERCMIRIKTNDKNKTIDYKTIFIQSTY